MDAFVALIRAVNVGGTGRLPMATLREICISAGFGAILTLGASGNAVFEAPWPEHEVGARLDAALERRLGARPGIAVRDAAAFARVAAANPFPDAEASRVHVLFLPEPASPAMIAAASGAGDGETLVLGLREIYVHYPAGAGRSRLRIPAAATATARNMNTVVTLARMAAPP